MPETKYPDQLIGDIEAIEREFNLNDRSDVVGVKRLNQVDFKKTDWQRYWARVLEFNFAMAGLDSEVYDRENLPETPYILAMNHTDMYSYFPLQVDILRKREKLSTAWVKSKYMKSRFVSVFYTHTGQLPVPSKQDTIQKMYQQKYHSKTRIPENQYRLLKDVFDQKIQPGEIEQQGLDRDLEEFLEYRDVVSYYHEQVMRLVGLKTREALFEHNLYGIVYPEGTRHIQLGEGFTGLAEFALHNRDVNIVPVGCNNGHRIYPGKYPFAKGGFLTYRIGKPVQLSDLKLPEDSVLFTEESRGKYLPVFEQATRRIMMAIHALLSEEHQNPELYGEHVS